MRPFLDIIRSQPPRRAQAATAASVLHDMQRPWRRQEVKTPRVLFAASAALRGSWTARLFFGLVILLSIGIAGVEAVRPACQTPREASLIAGCESAASKVHLAATGGLPRATVYILRWHGGFHHGGLRLSP